MNEAEERLAQWEVYGDAAEQENAKLQQKIDELCQERDGLRDQVRAVTPFGAAFYSCAHSPSSFFFVHSAPRPLHGPSGPLFPRNLLAVDPIGQYANRRTQGAP